MWCIVEGILGEFGIDSSKIDEIKNKYFTEGGEQANNLSKFNDLLK